MPALELQSGLRSSINRCLGHHGNSLMKCAGIAGFLIGVNVSAQLLPCYQMYSLLSGIYHSIEHRSCKSFRLSEVVLMLGYMPSWDLSMSVTVCRSGGA